MKKIHISESEATILKTILTGNYKIIIFGSRAKGTHRPFSDLDICLKSKGPIAFDIMSTLKAQFAESDLPYKVDLIDYYYLDAEFQEMIDKTGIKLVF